MQQMDGKACIDVVVKKCNQIKSLANIGNKLSINKRILIDSSVLFGKFLIIAQRSTKMQQHFRYELTDLPSSLFKDEIC